MVKNKNISGLLPKFKKDLLFIAHLTELDYIKKENNVIHIGANVTLERILDSLHTHSLFFNQKHLSKQLHFLFYYKIISLRVRFCQCIGSNMGVSMLYHRDVKALGYEDPNCILFIQFESSRAREIISLKLDLKVVIFIVLDVPCRCTPTRECFDG